MLLSKSARKKCLGALLLRRFALLSVTSNFIPRLTFSSYTSQYPCLSILPQNLCLDLCVRVCVICAIVSSNCVSVRAWCGGWMVCVGKENKLKNRAQRGGWAVHIDKNV